MSTEELLKEYILKHYKSLRDFCMRNNFAYSTISNIFKRGIMGSSVSLIISVCDRLDIEVDALASGKIVEKIIEPSSLTRHEETLIKAYRENPAMQSAVNKLLGVESEGGDIAEDIASTINFSIQKNIVSR